MTRSVFTATTACMGYILLGISVEKKMGAFTEALPKDVKWMPSTIVRLQNSAALSFDVNSMFIFYDVVGIVADFIVYLNPYTAEVLKVKICRLIFFRSFSRGISTSGCLRLSANYSCNCVPGFRRHDHLGYFPVVASQEERLKTTIDHTMECTMEKGDL